MLSRSVTQTPVGARWARQPGQRLQDWTDVRSFAGPPASSLRYLQSPHRQDSKCSPCISASGRSVFRYSSAFDSQVFACSSMRPVSTQIRSEDTTSFLRNCVIAPTLLYRAFCAAAISPLSFHTPVYVRYEKTDGSFLPRPTVKQHQEHAHTWSRRIFNYGSALDSTLPGTRTSGTDMLFSGLSSPRRDLRAYSTGCAKLTEEQADAAVTAAIEVLAKDVEEDIADKRERLKVLRQRHGKAKLGDVTVQNVVGGMRNLVGLLTETSVLDPLKGITYRGYTIEQLVEKLPRFANEEYPPVEGVIWLLLTGRLPTAEKARLLTTALTALSCSSPPSSSSSSSPTVSAATTSHFIPHHTHEALESLPTSVHPMTQLVVGVASLQPCSRLAAAYQKKTRKDALWRYALYDALSLIAKAAVLAARIFQRSFRPQAQLSHPQADLDWGANFAAMLGFKDNEAFDLIRLYLLLHADHEGGNVSAHTAHVVESALSDLYLSFSAGLSGLAGPLHGLANQECLKWLQNAHEQLQGEPPTPENVERVARQTLTKGQVIPGYGHAVLRVTDPRFLAQRQFALQHLKDDELFALLDVAYKVIPKILSETGKVQNPYPNVDCHSGVLLHHYGLKESNFYTVMFGVARAIGIAAQHVSSRGLMMPIERPKSITIEQLEEKVEALQTKT